MNDQPVPEFEPGEEARSWEAPKGTPRGLRPAGLYLGQGSNALEVAVARAKERPTAGEVKALWEKRHGKRASPLLCVVLYPREGIWQAAVCGPAGTDPRVVRDLELNQVERVCRAALEEPDRHAATRFLVETLPEDDTDLPGIRNVGMFATHYLRSGVPQRNDWSDAEQEGRLLLNLADRALVEGLGYAIESRDTTTSLLRADGAATAVAVFLQDTETADGPGRRYGEISPASHALAAADKEGLPYAVVTRGRQIRVYATGSNVGVGRKGRTETFAEANLAALPEGTAGYLPLIFGAKALRRGGTFEQLLERSRDFATGLGERLRDRVYEEAVPKLAAAVASRHPSGEEPDLESLYEQTLVILFRLLFVAYAEDKDLLPYRSSGEYSRHALKTVARELGDRLTEGPRDFDAEATDLWATIIQLFRAIELGNDDWQVPRYNGSLFSSEATISAAGAAIAELDLTNAEVGPALTALLVDESAEGTYGPVDFRSLSVREFGTIYEGLLESDLAVAGQDLAITGDGTYVPAAKNNAIEVPKGDIYLHNRSGARKATGSYFTKPFAVEHLLDHALEPALDDHLARLEKLLAEDNAAAAGDAFFDFRCADIAMGSGHFLVAAVDRIEARFSRFLAEHPIPSVTAELERLRKSAEAELGDLAAGVEIDHSSLLRRQVARRCIYGVDRNLIAVELARLAIWIHTFIPGLPLGFLDRTLVCGDSLTGIGTLDEAVRVLDPAADNPTAPSLYRERIEALISRTGEILARLARASDADAAEVQAARQAVREAEVAAQPARRLFDLLIAVRLDCAGPVEEIDEGVIAVAAEEAGASKLAGELHSLHFPLAFPEVFLRDRPGFDCLVGNPPWDKVRFEPQQFWVTRSPGLNALSVADRDAALTTLRAEQTTDAAQEVAEREDRERFQRYVKASFHHQGRGHYELAQLFVERALALLSFAGHLGYVLPRQSLVLGGWSEIRALLLDGGRLEVIQTQNHGGWLFENVHHSYMVVLINRAPAANNGTISPGADVWPAVVSEHDLADLKMPALSLNIHDLETLSTTNIVPWFGSTDAVGVFDKLRQCPQLASDRGWIRGTHDARWDFRGSGPNKDLATSEPGDDSWRILMTRHIQPFSIDDSHPTRRFVADPTQLREMNAGIVSSDSGVELGRDHPLIVFRHPARNDDIRTMIATALPRSGVIHNKGYVHGVRHDVDTLDRDLLALLTYMNSFVCDWWVRRIVDRHVTAPIVNGLRLPDWTESDRELAAELAIERLRSGGAKSLAGNRDLMKTGASTWSAEELVVRAESLAAKGFGLDRSDLEIVLNDFSDRACPQSLRESILAGSE